MSLGFEEIGNGGVRVVLLHGFTQTRAVWRETARRIVERLDNARCLLVDLPGHGESGGAPTDPAAASRLVTAIGGRATYVGYSLGARIALRACVDYPSLVERLVLVSGTAGIEDPSERAHRLREDAALADRIERIGVEAFLDEWLAQPIFRDLPASASHRSDRASNTASGLAASLREVGQGRTEPMWELIGEIHTPILAVAGSRDQKYAEIARRLASAAPQGSLKIIDGAGHSIPLERPDELADEIVHWMTSPSE